MKIIFTTLLFWGLTSLAQSDKHLINQLKSAVYFLADDKLEGRRTGTSGEKMAYDYLVNEYRKNKLSPVFGNEYGQPFEVNEGLSFEEKTSCSIGSTAVESADRFFPLPYSKNGSVTLKSWSGKIELLDIGSLINSNKDNPHFDLESSVYEAVKNIENSRHPELILVYNIRQSGFAFSFDKRNNRPPLNTLAVYCDRIIVGEWLNRISTQSPLNIQIGIYPKLRTGHNVSGFLNNQSKETIIIGAHYDHLGYGEDHNSLYAGKVPMIHNGADDNASGTAGLLSLMKLLQKKSYRKFNYLFVSFSGEELGLYGSKYFADHAPIDLKSVNYMINLDMIGRLNDSTRGLTIGGFGTSPEWSKLIDINDRSFHIKIDSAGSGPSDHTSFYRKDLPVLFFFTGTHSDYHKPSDDADKINFNGAADIVRYIEKLILKSTGFEKLSFTKTKESVASGKSSFKVTLGIMPDYTFSGTGVHVDGVSDNKPAQKAGIQTGDIIMKLGDYPVTDVQGYMKVLSHFNKGEKTTVVVKRDSKELSFEVIF